MQELLKEKQKADEEAEAASKNTVIKVLMGEVQVNIEIHKSYKLTLWSLLQIKISQILYFSIISG